MKIISISERATDRNLDEVRYLDANKDRQKAVDQGSFKNGGHHFKRNGRKEGRKQFCKNFSTPISNIRKRKAHRISDILRNCTIAIQ